MDEGIWRALSDPTRRRILDLLREQPLITGEVAASFDISRIAVMRHLDVLAGAGLVTSHKRGRERRHYVNLPPLLELSDRWASPGATGWARGLLRLREGVEAELMERAVDIAFEVSIAGSPEAVFAALTTEPGAWWGHPYLRPEASRLTLDVDLGGAMVEHWADGSALIATVTALAPDRLLALTGPFHLGLALGIATFDLRPEGEGNTIVAFSFEAVGAVEDEVAAGFETGFRDLVGQRLTALVETGKRLGLEPGPDPQGG